MKTVELGALVAPAQVQRAGNTDYPVLSMTMHDGLVAQTDRFKKRIASLDTSDYKVVRRGQLVVGFPINEGVLDFQLHHDAALVSPAYGVWNLRDESLADRTYLKRFLKSPRAIEYYVGKMKGSTARRRSLPPAEFNAMPIPLPPLTEQRRIAAILDHADTLRTKRRRVLAHLDALAQSIFHDMFGDPDESTENVDFGSLANLAGGRNLVAGDSAADTPYRVLKISAVTTGQFKPGESKPLPENYVPPAEHLVRAGDLLMSRANTTELVGAVAYVSSAPPNLALPDKVWRFEWTGDAEPVFYHALFSAVAVRRRISRLASGTGGSMKNVSKAKLATMPLPRVALNLQRAFVARAEQVAAQRAKVNDAAHTSNMLFTSLQSRAFRGEL